MKMSGNEPLKQKEIDVREQYRLPVDESFHFCMKGIRHRLLRSFLTLAVVAMAVAFFMFILAENNLLSSMRLNLLKEIRAKRTPALLFEKVFSPLSSVMMGERLADAHPESAAMEEYILISGKEKEKEAAAQEESARILKEIAEVSGSDGEKVRALSAFSARERLYTEFFQDLGAGRRSILVRKNRGKEIFRYLQEEENWKEFSLRLADMLNVELPGTTEELKSFVDLFSEGQKDLSALSGAYTKGVEKLENDMRRLIQGSASPAVCFAALSPNEIEALIRDRNAGAEEKELEEKLRSTLKAQSVLRSALLSGVSSECADYGALSEKDLENFKDTLPVRDWFLFASSADAERGWDLIRAAGFDLSETQTQQILKTLQTRKYKDDIIAYLQLYPVRDAWKKMFKSEPLLKEKMSQIASDRVKHEIMNDLYPDGVIGDIQLSDALDERLVNLERKLFSGGEKLSASGISSRQIFLLAISFLVCMVGIANAMLMAITERFREIATMKCLGATDGFVLFQFLLEAFIQGVAGGFVGTGVGFLLAALKCFALYGVYVVHGFSLIPMLESTGIAICTGILLAMTASVYPSWKASRMSPMDAMRVE